MKQGRKSGTAGRLAAGLVLIALGVGVVVWSLARSGVRPPEEVSGVTAWAGPGWIPEMEEEATLRGADYLVDRVGREGRALADERVQQVRRAILELEREEGAALLEEVKGWRTQGQAIGYGAEGFEAKATERVAQWLNASNRLEVLVHQAAEQFLFDLSLREEEAMQAALSEEELAGMHWNQAGTAERVKALGSAGLTGYAQALRRHQLEAAAGTGLQLVAALATLKFGGWGWMVAEVVGVELTKAVWEPLNGRNAALEMELANGVERLADLVCYGEEGKDSGLYRVFEGIVAERQQGLAEALAKAPMPDPDLAELPREIKDFLGMQ
jgi:hypothetical protein